MVLGTHPLSPTHPCMGMGYMKIYNFDVLGTPWANYYIGQTTTSLWCVFNKLLCVLVRTSPPQGVQNVAGGVTFYIFLSKTFRTLERSVRWAPRKNVPLKEK